MDGVLQKSKICSVMNYHYEGTGIKPKGIRSYVTNQSQNNTAMLLGQVVSSFPRLINLYVRPPSITTNRKFNSNHLRKHQQQIKVRISQDSWSRQSEPGGGDGGAGRELRFSSFSFILCLGYTLRTFSICPMLLQTFRSW